MGANLSSLFQDHDPMRRVYGAGGYQDDRQRRLNAMEDHIEAYGFQWIVLLVTAFGFYSASYALFATNLISPALAFVYWPDSTTASHGFDIDEVTLAATVFGMVLFGHFADLWGRKFLYGVELVFVVVGTLSIAQASAGFNDSMKVEGWIYFWRIVLGFGIGAEYPVTAIIAAEWSPTQLRGAIMASIFLMQSLGQLTASAVAYGVAVHLNKCQSLSQSACDIDVAGRAVDQFWRTVIGVGAFPAAIAILLRFSMRESTRWNLSARGEMADRVPQAANGAARPSNPAEGTRSTAHEAPVSEGSAPIASAAQGHGSGNGSHGDNPVESEHAMSRRGTSGSGTIGPFNYHDLAKYLSQGAWKRVAGVSLCWFILDIGYYGLGLNSPRIISRLWKSDSIAPPASLPDWNTDLVDPLNATIFEVLWRNSARNMVTISTGTIVGSFAIIAIINYVPRVRFMAVTFGVLAAVFVIFASVLLCSSVYDGPNYRFTVFVYAFIQFLFNVGPNTLTWILPAEIFPTKYRGTFYGIAAASGKLGAILVQGIFKRIGLTQPRASAREFAIPLYLFALVMLAGVAAAHYLVPEVQILASDIRDEQRELFAPRKGRHYPLYGAYRNLVLERIEDELDTKEDASMELGPVEVTENQEG